MANDRSNIKDLPFTGKLITATDPLTIGNNFRTLKNMEYTDTNPKSISGMTKINTSAAPRPTIKSAFHFTKDQPQESHVLIQAKTSTTDSEVFTNDTAIPSQGNFSTDALLTETASTVQTGRFSKAPNGNMVYCNGDSAYRWGGDELRVASFINYDPDDTFWYDYTDRVRNTQSDTDNLATVNVTPGGGDDSDALLLLHLDNNVTDDGATGHTVTNSNVTFSTSNKKFGTHAGEWSAGDYLSIPDHADFVLNDTDWTFDCWIRPTTLSAGGNPIYYQQNSGDANDYILIETNSSNQLLIKIYKDAGSVVNIVISNIIFVNNWYHIAFVYIHADTTYNLYVNGVRKASTVDSSAWDDPTGVVYIGSDTSTSFLGQMDEVRLSNVARWTGESFEAPSSAYSADNVGYFYIGSPVSLSGFTVTVGTANTTACVMAVNYWSDSGWTAVSSLVDGTSDTGVSLAQTGTVEFASVDGSDKPKVIKGVVLYWYKVELPSVDATTTISHVTLRQPLQTIKDTWDGIDRISFGVYKYDDSIYTDYTPNIYEDFYDTSNEYSYASLDALDDGDDYLVCGFSEKQMGLIVNIAPTKGNSTADTNLTVSYWAGDDWTAVSNITDGTRTDAGISLGQSGIVSWNPTDGGEELKKAISQEVQLYYYKLSWDTTLSEDVEVYYIAGIAAPVEIGNYSYPIYAGDSVWLLDETDRHRNKMIRSASNTCDIWNGNEAVELFIGDESKLVAGASLFMQLGSSLFEGLVICKKTETWVVINVSGVYYQFLVSPNIGCVSAGTMKSLNLQAIGEETEGKTVVMWQAVDGIYMFTGKSVLRVSADIENRFEVSDPTSVNTSYLNISEAFFDERSGYHWLFPSGASTTIDTELVFDTKRFKWYEINRGTGKALTCGCSVINTTGGLHSYGFITSYMERLNYGTTFDGSDIVSQIQIGDIMMDDEFAKDCHLDGIRLACVAKSNTDNLIQVSIYKDSCTTASETMELSPVSSGNRLALPFRKTKKGTSTANTGGRNALLHSVLLSMTTDDETVGFEPLGLSLVWKDGDIKTRS